MGQSQAVQRLSARLLYLDSFLIIGNNHRSSYCIPFSLDSKII
jgi:hypothetical protein